MLNLSTSWPGHSEEVGRELWRLPLFRDSVVLNRSGVFAAVLPGLRYDRGHRQGTHNDEEETDDQKQDQDWHTAPPEFNSASVPTLIR